MNPPTIKPSYKDYEYIYVRFEISPEDLETDTYGLFSGDDDDAKATASASGGGKVHQCRLVAPDDERAKRIGRTLTPPVSKKADLVREVVIKI